MKQLSILLNHGYKKGAITNFSPLLIFVVVGSGSQDPRSGMEENQNPG
jgi:hypothetical protein